MQSKLLLIGVILITALTLSGWALIRNSEDHHQILQKRAALVMRDIGHKILLHSADSTSHIPPVKRINNTTFQLDSQSQFSFVPDTLVNVVQRSLAAGNLPLHYLVSVQDCMTNELVYGFEIGVKKENIIPCVGRVQPAGCYTIQIMFTDLPATKDSTNRIYLFFITLTSVVAFVLSGKSLIKKNKSLLDKEEQPDSFIVIGNFKFYADRRILKINQETITLSDKECNLLRIFSINQDTLIERDTLLKEVWENEGVFVGRSLDVFISKLRRKLQQDPSLILVNIHGKGYKLETNKPLS